MSRPWKTHRVSRRLFLGGLGTMMALPLLESSLPRRMRSSGAARAAAPPEPAKRMLFYFAPNGVHMPEWTPAQTGADWTDTPILAPLAARGVKADTLVLSGLANAPGRPIGSGDHASGTGAFLTCHQVKKSTTTIRNAISVDQLAVPLLGSSGGFASLQLGVDPSSPVGDCESGYACAYANTISWASPTSPMPKVSDPKVLFDLMFAGIDPEASLLELERRKANRISLLNYVHKDAKGLQNNLGITDRLKLDEYLQAVSELDARVRAADLIPESGAPILVEGELNVVEQADLFSDLMVRALQTDMTRVISFMLANPLSQRSYDFLGIPEAHHEVSHHNNDPLKQAQLTTINTWEVDQFAKLAARLKAIPEDDGSTVLDHCTLYFGSEVSDGDTHTHEEMPILVAGGGSGLPQGQHIRVDHGRVSELFLTLLRRAGSDSDQFGDDGKRELPGMN